MNPGPDNEHSQKYTRVVEAGYFVVYLIIQGIISVGASVLWALKLPIKAYTYIKAHHFTLIVSIKEWLTHHRSRINLKKPLEQTKVAVEAGKNHVDHYQQQLQTSTRQWNLRSRIVTGSKRLYRGGAVLVTKGIRAVLFVRNTAGSMIQRVPWKRFNPLPPIVSGIAAIGGFFLSKRVRYFLLGTAVCFVALFSWQSYLFVKRLPSPENIGKLNFPTSTHIQDRNGELLYEIYNDQNRTPITLDDVPEHMKEATIAIEDKDFYDHNGVSLFNGIVRALRDTYLTGELQGGSTITQQLVKTALLTPERTIERKIKEMILAVWTENLYTKDEILEMYLNQVPYGGANYGIEEAANTYFDKSVAELTVAESAFLAGLPQAPSLYSPYLNPRLATQRRNDVLRRMYEEQFITEEELQNALRMRLVVRPPEIDIQAPHFVFYTKQKLEEEYGASRVEEGGLRVTTTLDLEVQNETEKILQEEIEKISHMNVSNGAVLITKPQTGEILAMVGSVDFYQQPFGSFNVTTALRQPGSSIKPIMYSLALENGYTAATLVDDSPTVFDIPGSQPYRPVNYDGKFRGKVPIRAALANSYNIPAVKVLETLGVQRFIYHAEKMGITTWSDRSRYGLSLTLGGGEVRMTDLAEAFGVFASEGELINLTGVQSVETLYGDTITYSQPQPRQVMNPGITYIMSDMLSDNKAREQAFGPNSLLEIPGHRVAVKTGTTNDLKDNWTVGYTPDYLVAVWVGNNDSTPMNQNLVSGVTGAAPIWNRVMTYLVNREKEYETETNRDWYDKPVNVVAQDCYGQTEYFIIGTERIRGCGRDLQNQTVRSQISPEVYEELN